MIGIIKIIEIVVQIRSDYFGENEIATGSCDLVSRAIKNELDSLNIESIIVDGYFLSEYNADELPLYYSHIWLEIDGMIFDATGDQFSEITDAVIFDTYENQSNYYKYKP